ncbi:MAG: ABC transporter permease [Proteobacteria bacterium]|nr:ABC transporter permease [Pseudomonadota bacterium]MBU4294538.1 ABC transporter permease [Pseudomonadota bacterium]MCG2747074.1 ABC transporter permease [Desulfobulbaceae bacterium]
MRLLAVIDRDLKKFRRNPVVIAMSILMPILYLVILGNSFQGKLQGLPLAVVRDDTGQSSRRVMENLRAIAAGPQTFSIISLKDQQEAIAGVKAGIYKAAIIIPADFSRKVAMQAVPEIGLFLDNTDGISAESIRGAVNGAIRAIKTEYVPIREKADEVRLRDINLYAKVDYFQSLVPGVVIMAIFLGALTTGAFNLVMDRFLGVDESYMLTPLSKMDIVGGLIISGLLVTTCIATLIFIVSILITGIPFTNWLKQGVSVLVVIVLTTLGLLSMMFVLMGRLSHPRIVGILSGFLNVILFFPSGAVYPIASFPHWLQLFAKVNPEAYAVHALKTILFKGTGISSISHDLAFLACFTIVMMTTAVLSFKRTVR